MLLGLWATWCAPCVRELPALALLQGAIAANRFAIVVIDIGYSNAARTAACLKAREAGALAVYLASRRDLAGALRAQRASA